jgi:hypothetical protein
MRQPARLFHNPFPFLPNAFRSSLLSVPLSLSGCAAHADLPPIPSDRASFETHEYHALKALQIIKASALYAR